MKNKSGREIKLDKDKLLGEIAECIRKNQEEGVTKFQKRNLDKIAEAAVFDAVNQVLLKSGKIDYEILYTENSHQFPDIVIQFREGMSMGIEVKSSSSNNNSWTINGNSVLGSTSIDVDDMYIIFIKYNESGFSLKYASYPDSIADVIVTHSPRYKIDLNIDKSQNFFKKSGISYQQLKSSENPIELITKYFREIGKTAWWLGSNQEQMVSATILSWSDLSSDQIAEIYGQAFVLFPELFAQSGKKYQNLAKWLVAKYSVLDSSLRDRFSAGGQVTLSLDVCFKDRADNKIFQAPKVFETISQYQDEVIKAMNSLSYSELSEFWVDYQPKEDSLYDRKRYWAEQISRYVQDEALRRYLFALIKISLP